jgi:hypothetical protein
VPADRTAAQAEALIGFLAFFSTENDGHLGAAMVTNERGYPLEFRVTTAVRPSPVQRALYGKSLEPYILMELIGEGLLKELQRRPSIILVNRLAAADLTSTSVVAFVAHAEEFLRTDNDRYDVRRVETDDVRLVVATGWGASARADSALEALSMAVRYFDPVEAFERMHTAVSVLGQTDDRYR